MGNAVRSIYRGVLSGRYIPRVVATNKEGQVTIGLFRVSTFTNEDINKMDPEELLYQCQVALLLNPNSV